MELKFHPVTESNDIERVQGLAQRIWREHYTGIIGEQQVEYMLDTFHSKSAITQEITERNYIYYLMMEGDRGLGYFAVQPSESTLFLSKLYVLDSERGSGVGRAAMKAIMDMAKERQLSRISLTVNKDNAGSIAAYTRLGFVTTGEVVADIGSGYVMDDYKMELTL